MFCFALHWPVFGLLKWCNLPNNGRRVVYEIFSWMKLWNIWFLPSTVSLKASPLLSEKVSIKCKWHSCLQVTIRKLARFMYGCCALAPWWALQCKRENAITAGKASHCGGLERHCGLSLLERDKMAASSKGHSRPVLTTPGRTHFVGVSIRFNWLRGSNRTVGSTSFNTDPQTHFEINKLRLTCQFSGLKGHDLLILHVLIWHRNTVYFIIKYCLVPQRIEK